MAKRKVQSQEKLLIRLPDGMRQRIAEAARANGRSMTAELVRQVAENAKGRKAARQGDLLNK